MRVRNLGFWTICASAFAVCILSSVFAAASPEQWVVGGNDKTIAHNCHGGTAVIDGNRNHLTLQECATVQINGNDNVIDATAPDAVNAVGNRNQISWSRKADGTNPKVSNMGTGNKIQEKK